MKAIVFRKTNEWPEMEDISLPKSVDQVEVKLNASALNHRDIWITKGQYPRLEPGVVMGSDGAGFIDNKRVVINPNVEWGRNEAYQSKEFRVLGIPDHGTFAESIFVKKEQIIETPSHLSDEEAAALPVAGATAYRALIKRCQIQKGENVLISGIGGGVAMMAALFANAKGGNVFYTTGSEEKLEIAKSYGFDKGVIYNNPHWVEKMMELSGGIDVVIDSAAGDGFASFIKLANYGARIAFYGGGKGKINNINPQVVFWKQISILGSTMSSDSDFNEMINFVSDHKIIPIIDKVYNFYDYKKAFERMNASNQFGKIILKIR
jgi:NADPH:quinone reductase-like Zn-dependent oxidoreductase